VVLGDGELVLLVVAVAVANVLLDYELGMVGVCLRLARGWLTSPGTVARMSKLERVASLAQKPFSKSGNSKACLPTVVVLHLSRATPGRPTVSEVIMMLQQLQCWACFVLVLLAAVCSEARVGDGSFAALNAGMGTKQRAGTQAEMQTLEQMYTNARRNTPSSMAQADGATSGASPTSPMSSMGSLMRFSMTRGGGLARTHVGSYNMGSAGQGIGNGQARSSTGLDAVAKQGALIGSTADASELAKELAWEREQQQLHRRSW